MPHTLSTDRIRACYNRLGKYDFHGRFEDPAMDLMVRHGRFEEAEYVFEFGCGTGHLAEKLFKTKLTETARYVAVDVSPVMVERTSKRLKKWKDRTNVILTDGSMEVDEASGKFDRFVSTYVMDLLWEEDSKKLISEARRVLVPGGLLCLASLIQGTGTASRVVTTLWKTAWRIAPIVVGGCRPVNPAGLLGPDQWSVVFKDEVTSWGLTSEVVVAERLPGE